MKFVNIRMWLFLFGAIFLIAAYLFQQSQTNQKQLHQQAMKSIELTRINFQHTLEGYHKRLDDFLMRWFLSNSDTSGTSPASKLVKILDPNPSFPILEIKYFEKKDSIYTLQRHRNLKVVALDSSFIFEEDYLFTFDQGYWDFPTSTYNPENLIEYLRSQKNWKYVEDTLYTNGSGYYGITHPISFYDLMKHNLNNKFFDEIYVLDDAGNVLYPNNQKGMILFVPEDLYSNSTDPEGNRLMKLGNKNIRLQINSEEHEVFIAPVALGGGYLFLAGIKELGQFQKVALRIDYNLLSAFVIALLIIFVSIPVFSMLNMDLGDVLTKNKVYILGLSLIVLSLIMGFTLAFLKNQYQDEDYKQVMGDIMYSYESTMSTYVSYLDNNFETLQELDSSLYTNINEYIEYNDLLEITRLKIFKRKEDINFNENNFISIAHRDYAQYANKKKKFISAHYSQINGELEGVLSQYYCKEYKKAITFNLSNIAPEESSKARFFVFKPDGKVLYKSQKVTIPVSYISQAVDESKWKQISSLVNNNTATEPKWEIPLYVNGYEYLGVLKKLHLSDLDQPLWMLYLIDQNIEHLKSSFVSLGTILLLSFYILLLITLSALSPIATQKNIYLSTKPFLYSWFAPNKNKRNQFLLLNFVLLFQILIIILIYNFLPHNVLSLFLWFSLFAIQTSTIKFSLLHPDKPRPYVMDEKNYLFILGCLWMISAVLLVWMVVLEGLNVLVLLTSLFIILLCGYTVIYCLRVMSSEKLPRFDPLEVGNYKNKRIEFIHKTISDLWVKVAQSKAPKRIFSISFLLWAILIGFLPGYMLHREIYYQENNIGSKMQNLDRNYTYDPSRNSYNNLIETYESFRRWTFSHLSEYNDEFILNFINADYNVISLAFANQILKINFKPEGLFNSFILFITISLIFWLMFKLIMYLSKRIFLTEFLFSNSNALTTHLIKNRREFIVCADSTRAKEWIDVNQGVKIHPGMCINLAAFPIVKVTDMPNEEDAGTALVIENLHILIKQEDVITILTPLLEKAEKYTHVFIISGVTFKEMVNSLDKSEALLFSELFSSFIFHTVPIQYQKGKYKLPYQGNNEYIRLLNREFNYGPNVDQIMAYIIQELDIKSEDLKRELNQEKFEKCILKIQRYNKAYFINIWHELSFREKKMVYYLAKEGFVNYANKEIITLLIEKGIIIEKNGLELFSCSFKNFVIQFISADLKKSFVKDEKQHGNAGNILTAAISFVFISLAVISYYDPNILNQTSAYVSAVIGLAGTVFSAFNSGLSFLSRKGQGAESS